MKDFISKHKERVALGGMVVAFMFFVGGGIYLQKQNRQEKAELPDVVEKTVDLQKAGNRDQSSGAGGAITAFFLKPSASELLEELSEMENLNQDVVQKKFLNLRVLWQAYFFNVTEIEGGKTHLLLDVSEDGFGVEIQSEVRGALYPQIVSLNVGDPLWIAGEILAVDPAGTGTVYLKCEYLSFGPEPPLSTKRKSSADQQP
ncbi:MAG: hypothetical protein ACN4GW_10330 [Desulforhopalus sp.]